MTNPNTLKPCPFCGETAQFEKDQSNGLMIGFQWHDYLGPAFKASCGNCGATGPTERIKKEAIQAWNTRAECK